MNLHHGDQRGIEIIRFGFLGVENFHLKGSTGNREDRLEEKSLHTVSRRQSSNLQL